MYAVTALLDPSDPSDTSINQADYVVGIYDLTNASSLKSDSTYRGEPGPGIGGRPLFTYDEFRCGSVMYRECTRFACRSGQ